MFILFHDASRGRLLDSPVDHLDSLFLHLHSGTHPPYPRWCVAVCALLRSVPQNDHHSRHRHCALECRGQRVAPRHGFRKFIRKVYMSVPPAANVRSCAFSAVGPRECTVLQATWYRRDAALPALRRQPHGYPRVQDRSTKS